MKMDKETCLRIEYMTLMQKAYQPDKESLLECHVRIFRYYCERIENVQRQQRMFA